MTKKLRQVYKICEKKYTRVDYKYHVLLVVKYAKLLAKKYKVDQELAELAALLHDIGRLEMKDDPEHHTIGVPRAERILKKIGYPKETREAVKYCVLTHRTGRGPAPKTMLAKIVANADAMSHFDMLPVFFRWRAQREEIEDTVAWVEQKLKKDLKEKITLPEAKKMVKSNYKAIQQLLNSIK